MHGYVGHAGQMAKGAAMKRELSMQAQAAVAPYDLSFETVSRSADVGVRGEHLAMCSGWARGGDQAQYAGRVG